MNITFTKTLSPQLHQLFKDNFEVLDIKPDTFFGVIGDAGGCCLLKDKEYYLYNFCIAKEHRRKGYATALLQACAKYNPILFVHKSNKPAISLYKKNGYKVQKSMKGGYIMKA